MKLEPNNISLSFADFLEAALRDKADTKPFPYTLEVCRCRYCSYCQSGKCALKRCCCIDMFTPKKFEVLKKYLDKYDLKGGIVRNDERSDELCICTEHYSDDIQSDDWAVLGDLLEQ